VFILYAKYIFYFFSLLPTSSENLRYQISITFNIFKIHVSAILNLPFCFLQFRLQIRNQRPQKSQDIKFHANQKNAFIFWPTVQRVSIGHTVSSKLTSSTSATCTSISFEQEHSSTERSSVLSPSKLT